METINNKYTEWQENIHNSIILKKIILMIKILLNLRKLI
jgi:hypothetical protein